MFRKILGIAVTLMLFAGVVSASSINGDYKGNPIVKVTSNGKLLETDEVPGMIYDGHTVVPISLLRQLGASVVWDGNTYTVDVKISNSQNPVISNVSDIEKLKAYSKATEHYKKLVILGNALEKVGVYIDASMGMISPNNQSVDNFIQASEKQIKQTNELITLIMEQTNEIYDDLKSKGVDISDTKTIINNYAASLKKYGDTLDSVEKYYTSHANSDADTYFSNSTKAFESLKGPRTDSNARYYEWYNKVQNY